MNELDEELVAEAKAIVALAFRNGPIEDLHAGPICPHCHGKPEYSHVTDAEMKSIMQFAVSKVYALLWGRQHDAEAFAVAVKHGNRFTTRWDDPK